MNTYFDNAATSFPKPKQVSTAISNCLENIAGSYGRGSSTNNISIAQTFFDTREQLANLFNINDSSKIIFTLNATMAMNTILFGLNLKNRHILISPMEHNCVTRPLNYLQQKGIINYDTLPADTDGFIKINEIKQLIKPNTALVIINHESNINGVVQNLTEIKQQIKDIPLLIDASQSAGHFQIDNQILDSNFIVFTGHKALLGPTGIGGFYIKDQNKVSSFIYGGTGSISESLNMPEFTPDKFEAGTPNIIGVYGLNTALHNLPEYINNQDIYNFIKELKYNTDYKVYSANDFSRQGFVISITHPTKSITDIHNLLQSKYNIISRIGLHCSPLAHQHINTYPTGTIRFSFSAYHRKEDIEFLLSILKKLQD